ncbi:MAG: nicotinate (nicotinamide) nucleotide adenylyltransferase [Marinifilaceae bacterium]
MIGLFFGSFNPIHNGHIQIARYLLLHGMCTEVWFVVSPCNPFKVNMELLAETERIALVRKAIAEHPGMKAIDVEFDMPRPSYTIDTLRVLRRQYATERFALIMGGDNLRSLHLWKEYREILNTTPIFVYPRPGEVIEHINYPGVTVIDAPQTDISSTQVRELVKTGGDLSAYIPKEIITDVIQQYGSSAIVP